MAAPILGKLFFAWLLLRSRTSAPGTTSNAAPGKGGITKQLTLKGLDGRRYLITFFSDGTRLVDTDKAAFFTRGSKPEAILVTRGDAAAVKDALANLPE